MNPEQYVWGNIGGWFATELKYAGYDGFIIEGKAQSPVHIKIEDDKIEILPADDLWGMRVHQAQSALEEKYSHEFKSMVIGPAGENLVRIASITTSNDCVFAKGGFGAVWGSKQLKSKKTNFGKIAALFITFYAAFISGCIVSDAFGIPMYDLTGELYMFLAWMMPLERVIFSLFSTILGVPLMLGLPKIKIYAGPQFDDSEDAASDAVDEEMKGRYK